MWILHLLKSESSDFMRDKFEQIDTICVYLEYSYFWDKEDLKEGI